MSMDVPLIFLVSLLLMLAASDAALPQQVYWNTVLPKTPMPNAIRELLYPDLLEEKSGTAVTVGKGGVGVDTRGKKGRTVVGVTPAGVNVHTGGNGGGTAVGVGKGGVNVSTNPKGKPVIVHVGPYPDPFGYLYKANDDQTHDDPAAALFFQEKDLRPGSKMTVQFFRTVSGATFYPRKVAESIPFSSKALPEILAKFSVQPNTISSKTMATTLQECEELAIEGETKFCATSLESMVDFMTSKLGTRSVFAVSTIVSREGTKRQVYTMTSGVRLLGGGESKAGACHAQPYVYAVFSCHVSKGTKVYTVPMIGSDGTMVEAVAVCHTDTSKWNPNHLAFKVLNVKPGTTPVCHFLPQDHVVWVSKN